MDITPSSTSQIPLELFRERNPSQMPGKPLPDLLQRGRRKTWIQHQDVLALRLLAPNRVKEAREYTFQLLFTQKKKPNLRVPGSSFQGPDPRLWVFDCSPYKEMKSSDSTKKQAPTTLLLPSPTMNPDISLRETKALYPLQTSEEAKDLCLHKIQRPRASTSY